MFYLFICFFFLFSVLFLFQPKLSLFVNFLVLFRFHSKICKWVFVWWKTGVFAQVGSTLIFSLTICTVFLCTLWGLQGKWVPLGNSLAFIKLHKIRFLGPFRIPTQTFTFIVPPTNISLSLKTKHQARLSVTGQLFAGIRQWPKGLLGRGCLHQSLYKY